MPPSVAPRSRKVAAFAGLTAAGLLGIAGFATPAFAHHPEVVAEADCDGSIDFTSQAWVTSNAAARTNSKIGVSYSVDGGAFTALPQKAEYRYDADNGFQFSDTIEPPAGWDQVKIKVTALAKWGNGAAAGDSRTTTVEAPEGCTTPAEPEAGIVGATCAQGGSLIRLSNDGGEPVDFTVEVEGEADRTIAVGAGEDHEEVVPVPEGEATTISISAPGMDTVTADVEYDCPLATVAAAECDGLATLTNPGGTPVDFTISVPGRDDVVVPVSGGGTEEVDLDLPEDATTTVTISAEGMDDVVVDVDTTCEDEVPAPTPPVEDDDAPAAGGGGGGIELPELDGPASVSLPTFAIQPLPEPEVAVIPDAVLGESIEAPAVETAPMAEPQVLSAAQTAPAAEASPAGELPMTGGTTWPLVLTGLGMLVPGAAMARMGRRASL